jgi:hypothetical protein
MSIKGSDIYIWILEILFGGARCFTNAAGKEANRVRNMSRDRICKTSQALLTANNSQPSHFQFHIWVALECFPPFFTMLKSKIAVRLYLLKTHMSSSSSQVRTKSNLFLYKNIEVSMRIGQTSPRRIRAPSRPPTRADTTMYHTCVSKK